MAEDPREDLWGEIVRDYHEGQEALYAIRRTDGILEEGNSPEVYFAQPDDFFAFEAGNLSAVRAPVLDVGAGPGRMMLWAQDEGLEVIGVESSPLTAAVARKRGAIDLREGRWQDFDDLLSAQENGFRTVLLMGHNLGLAGTLTGLETMLHLLHHRTVPGAALIASSIDFSATENPEYLAGQRKMREEGRYPGELSIRVEYQGRVGPYFPWLLVEPDDLARVGERCGWLVENIHHTEGGHYGVVLRRFG